MEREEIIGTYFFKNVVGHNENPVKAFYLNIKHVFDIYLHILFHNKIDIEYKYVTWFHVF